MDPIGLIEQSTGYAEKMIKGIKPDQMKNATPCADFDVHGLLNHMLSGLVMLTTAAETGTATMPDGDQVGADPASEYAVRRKKLLEAWRGEGVMQETLTMPFGAIPAQMMAGIAFMEHLVHGWDLAKATGQVAFLGRKP
jgi:uncharacterized protein (TIGR03086 family)